MEMEFSGGRNTLRSSHSSQGITESYLSTEEQSSTNIAEDATARSINLNSLEFTLLNRRESGDRPVFKSQITMQGVGDLAVSGYEVSHAGLDGRLFPQDPVPMVGRLGLRCAWEYINGMKKTKENETIVFRLAPATGGDTETYRTFYEYLASRNRLGVLGNLGRSLREAYLYPLKKDTPINESLLPFRGGPGITTERTNCLLAIVIRKSGDVKQQLLKTKRLTSKNSDGVKKAKVDVKEPLQSTSFNSSDGEKKVKELHQKSFRRNRRIEHTGKRSLATVSEESPDLDGTASDIEDIDYSKSHGKCTSVQGRYTANVPNVAPSTTGYITPRTAEIVAKIPLKKREVVSTATAPAVGISFKKLKASNFDVFESVSENPSLTPGKEVPLSLGCNKECISVEARKPLILLSVAVAIPLKEKDDHGEAEDKEEIEDTTKHEVIDNDNGNHEIGNADRDDHPDEIEDANTEIGVNDNECEIENMDLDDHLCEIEDKEEIDDTNADEVVSTDVYDIENTDRDNRPDELVDKGEIEDTNAEVGGSNDCKCEIENTDRDDYSGQVENEEIEDNMHIIEIGDEDKEKYNKIWQNEYENEGKDQCENRNRDETEYKEQDCQDEPATEDEEEEQILLRGDLMFERSSSEPTDAERSEVEAHSLSTIERSDGTNVTAVRKWCSIS